MGGGLELAYCCETPAHPALALGSLPLFCVYCPLSFVLTRLLPSPVSSAQTPMSHSRSCSLPLLILFFPLLFQLLLPWSSPWVCRLVSWA